MGTSKNCYFSSPCIFADPPPSPSPPSPVDCVAGLFPLPLPLLSDPGRLPQLPPPMAAAAAGAVVVVASLDPAEVDPPVVEVEVVLAGPG